MKDESVECSALRSGAAATLSAKAVIIHALVLRSGGSARARLSQDLAYSQSAGVSDSRGPARRFAQFQGDWLSVSPINVRARATAATQHSFCTIRSCPTPTHLTSPRIDDS